MMTKLKKQARALAICAVLLVSMTGASMGEIVPDDNTVLLDHFNGITLADYVGGESTFVDSLPTLGQAANFPEGTYLRYDLPGWYKWPTTYDPTGKEGTIELWVKPRRYGEILVFQWNKVYTPPPAGYIIRHLDLDSDGRLFYSVWYGHGGMPGLPVINGDTTIPLNQWTYIAVSWGPAGTKIYVNGKVDISTDYCIYPALNPGLYVYVNRWGKTDLGAIDELHISKIQRTDEEIWSHYAMKLVVPATIDIDPNTLNLKSKGKWVTAYIELPEGYDVSNIDVGTVMLNDLVSAEPHPTGIGDYDYDGIADLMVKFDSSAVQEILEPGEEVEITVTGEVAGTPFEGSDTIRVIDKGKGK